MGTQFIGSAKIVTPNNPPVPFVQYSISLKAFMKRFTAAEREQLQELLLNGTAVQKRKLGAFRDYLQLTGDVELNDDYIIAAVNLMETAGILVAGRAAQILTP